LVQKCGAGQINRELTLDWYSKRGHFRRMWHGKWGVSEHTIYAWKAKYGGMDVSEALYLIAKR